MTKMPIPFRVVENIGTYNFTVILSPMGEDDYISYAEWMNDFDVTKYIGRNAKAISYTEQKEWVERQHNGSKAAFGIWVKAKEGEPKLVGNCSIIPASNNTQSATIGIVIGNPTYRGKGVGSAVVGLLLNLAFLDMNLHSINLTVVADNESAIRCYEKNGFVKQGVMRDRSFYNGEYHNEIYMDILREEWNNEK